MDDADDALLSSTEAHKRLMRRIAPILNKSATIEALMVPPLAELQVLFREVDRSMKSRKR